MRCNGTLYLDYQATTPLDERVWAAMEPHYRERFGNPHSVDHIIGWRAHQAVERAAEYVGRLVGVDPDEVIFTSGATEANNLALFGLAAGAEKSGRRRILVSAIEHKCVLAAARALENQGFEIALLPVLRDGSIDLDAAASLMGEDVLLVSVMAVNNEIGTIEPLAEISALARQHGALVHCDAAQAPCTMDMGAFSEVADAISLSAHKFYGPQGIGALIVRRELQGALTPVIHGGGQQNGLRSGTLPLALCVGMGEAAALLERPEAAVERTRVATLRNRFVEQLMNSDWLIDLNGPPLKDRHSGNANLRFIGFDGHDILAKLQTRLAASTGSACTSGTPEASHVLRAIGLSEEEAEASIRFSLGRFTAEEDIDEAVSLIFEALAQLSHVGLTQLA